MAGRDTVDEITDKCPSSECPKLWDWIGRLSVLKAQLEADAFPENLQKDKAVVNAVP